MDLVAYLETLPVLKLDKLYENAVVCHAILTNLPYFAGQYVSRLLFLDEAIPHGIISSWAQPSAAAQHEAAVALLTQLHVLVESVGKGSSSTYGLNPTFQKNAQQAVLSGQGAIWPASKSVEELGIHQETIDALSARQWEDISLFLVGSRDRGPRPQLGLEECDIGGLLLGAGLMAIQPGHRTATVTEAGFQFLLADSYQQLWQILRVYITQAEESARMLGCLSHTSVIKFLLKLGLKNECFQLDALDDLERPIAMHMAHLGVLVPVKKNGIWLAPSRMAAALSQGSARLDSKHSGFVIVETNFRVYAYTTSQVHQSILRLFVRCDVLLPNLFVGTIERKSVVSALDGGITAQQIVRYLQTHAHPHIRKNVPVVPEVVTDQINLWQWELQRLAIEPCVYYSNFESPELYQITTEFASSRGYRVFSDDERSRLVVTANGHEECKGEIKRVKALLRL